MQNKKLNFIILKKVIPWLLVFGIAFFMYLGERMQRNREVDSLEVLTEPEVDLLGQTDAEASEENEDNTAEKSEKKSIFIDVSGAVNKPMVITLPEGSRVFQAIDLAGGIKESADTKNLNLAEVLMDGQKLYVQTKEEVLEETESKPLAAKNTRDTPQDDRINLNQADSDELQRLKGIGPSMAQRILDYRKEYGSFKNIEELKNVKGIGEKTFEKLKNNLYIN